MVTIEGWAEEEEEEEEAWTMCIIWWYHMLLIATCTEGIDTWCFRQPWPGESYICFVIRMFGRRVSTSFDGSCPKNIKATARTESSTGRAATGAYRSRLTLCARSVASQTR